MNHHDALHPLQVEAWRSLTYPQRWELARKAQKMVVDATARRLRRQHPEWPPERLNQAVARCILRGNS